MNEVDVEVKLNSEELETLHKIHVATAIRQTIQTQGWDFITDMVQKMINRLEDQHLNFGGESTQEAYWLSGARLAGARMFAKILQQQIAKEVNLDLTPPTRTRQPEE